MFSTLFILVFSTHITPRILSLGSHGSRYSSVAIGVPVYSGKKLFVLNVELENVGLAQMQDSV